LAVVERLWSVQELPEQEAAALAVEAQNVTRGRVTR